MDPIEDWIERKEVALGFKLLALWRWLRARLQRKQSYRDLLLAEKPVRFYQLGDENEASDGKWA